MNRMQLLHTTPDAALALVEQITAHVPGDEPAGRPHIVAQNSLITVDDERFTLEIDAETGNAFVTRVRSAGPNLAEMTVWQHGQELSKTTAPWGDPAA